MSGNNGDEIMNEKEATYFKANLTGININLRVQNAKIIPLLLKKALIDFYVCSKLIRIIK